MATDYATIPRNSVFRATGAMFFPPRINRTREPIVEKDIRSSLVARTLPRFPLKPTRRGSRFPPSHRHSHIIVN